MKKRNLLFALALTLSGQLFFSCNTARHYEFPNRTEAYHSDKAVVKAEPQKAETAAIATSEIDSENLTASEGIIAPLPAQPLVNLAPQTNVSEIKDAVIAEKQVNFNVSKADRKELKKALKLYKKQGSAAEFSAKPTVDIIELIFAIFIPPIGVLLHDDGISTRFWISLLLTILFFFPGMIYAILVVTDTI